MLKAIIGEVLSVIIVQTERGAIVVLTCGYELFQTWIRVVLGTGMCRLRNVWDTGYFGYGFSWIRIVPNSIVQYRHLASYIIIEPESAKAKRLWDVNMSGKLWKP